MQAERAKCSQGVARGFEESVGVDQRQEEGRGVELRGCLHKDLEEGRGRGIGQEARTEGLGEREQAGRQGGSFEAHVT